MMLIFYAVVARACIDLNISLYLTCYYSMLFSALQVFGELAVLDCEVLSPVSAISSTAVEVFCFDINAMAHVQWLVALAYCVMFTVAVFTRIMV